MPESEGKAADSDPKLAHNLQEVVGQMSNVSVTIHNVYLEAVTTVSLEILSKANTLRSVC